MTDAPSDFDPARRAMVLGIVTAALMGSQGVEVEGAHPVNGTLWVTSHGERYCLQLVSQGPAEQPREHG